MPITAQDLIKDKGEPVTTQMDSPILDVITIMQRNDYSQLPIVDVFKKQHGIVTSEGILKAQRMLQADLVKLKVSHVVTKAATISPDDDVSDVYELFHKHHAVLVVDGNNTLMGIITPWDAVSLLQQRATDMMLIEDIESSVKKHVYASFTDRKTGKLLQEELDKAIAGMLDHSEQISRDVLAGLKQYLAKSNIVQTPTLVLVKSAFSKLLDQNHQRISFDELSLHQYIELLLKKDRWDAYACTFSLEAGPLRRLLGDVREIRNQLAHFRGQINNDQRDLLRFCHDLLERHKIPEWQFEITDTDDRPSIKSSDEIVPTQEDLTSGESRYAHLALYLQQIPTQQEKVEITFIDIENIIKADLPPSARLYLSWWGNDSADHLQSQQWLDAGWRISRVNLTDGKVIFTRSGERNQLYINFYSRLLSELKKDKSFVLHEIRPDGQCWLGVANLPRTGRKKGPALLAFSFSRRSRFRVELYIDTGDVDKNKRIFDLLYAQQHIIESEMEQKLDWERLDNRRACRIALYHSGSIGDGDDKQTLLREWAVDRMIRFDKVIADRAEIAIRSVI